MAKTYFVTGTDTGVGKTLVSAALLYLAQHRGLTTLGLKPVAAGAQQTAEGLRNEDAVLLREYSSLQLPYAQTNPVCLPLPVAPHIAAVRAGQPLRLDKIEGFVRGALLQRVGLCILEGAGGWRVPLNEREYLSDLPKRLQLPVILVVGLRLGCINHALLTAQAIAADGLPLAGWVGSFIDPKMPEAAAVVASLQGAIAAPCLGVAPWMEAPCVKQVAAVLKGGDILGG